MKPFVLPDIPVLASEVLLAEKNGDKQTVAGQCKKALGDYHLSGITPQSLQASLSHIDAEVYAAVVKKEDEPLLADVFTHQGGVVKAAQKRGHTALRPFFPRNGR